MELLENTLKGKENFAGNGGHAFIFFEIVGLSFATSDTKHDPLPSLPTKIFINYYYQFLLIQVQNLDIEL